jgi:hypothetical protein
MTRIVSGKPLGWDYADEEGEPPRNSWNHQLDTRLICEIRVKIPLLPLRLAFIRITRLLSVNSVVDFFLGFTAHPSFA